MWFTYYADVFMLVSWLNGWKQMLEPTVLLYLKTTPHASLDMETKLGRHTICITEAEVKPRLNKRGEVNS